MWAAGHPAWVSRCHIHRFLASFRRMCTSSNVSGAKNRSYAPGGCSAHPSMPLPRRPGVHCRSLQEQQATARRSAGSVVVRMNAGGGGSHNSQRRQLQPLASGTAPVPGNPRGEQRPTTQRQLNIDASRYEARTKVVNSVYRAHSDAQQAASHGPGLPEVERISSPSNAYVKHLVRLRSSGTYRRELRRGLLVGTELLKEASGDPRVPLRVRVLLLQEGLSQPPRGVVADRVVRATEAVLKKVSGVESAGGVEAVAELDLPAKKSLRELLNELRGDGITFPHLTTSVAANNHPPIQSATAELAMLPTSSTTPAVCSAPARTASPVRLLVLDGVQDPGNLGTLARSALAFGWGGLFLLHGCCDPFNEKAVRASRGALLRLPLAAGSLEELRDAAREAELLLLSADMEEREERMQEGEEERGEGDQKSWRLREGYGREEERGGEAGSCQGGELGFGLLESGGLLELLNGGGEPTSCSSSSNSGSSNSNLVQTPQSGASGRMIPGLAALGGVALVLGSEGAGLSPAVRQLCAPVSVPMEGEMESLNVGVAGAILMFALSKGPPALFGKLAARLRAAKGVTAK